MAESNPSDDDLLARARRGDPSALPELFGKHRDRLRRMVAVRLDRRLQGRVDPSDVLQEAYLDAHRRREGYLDDPAMPPFLWLRFLTHQRLLAIHRLHLTKGRDPARENPAMVDSMSLANFLLGRATSPSLAAVRGEILDRLRAALDAMEPFDREVLVLRHFEELSNAETAEVLGLRKSAASNRYSRAIRRLSEVLSTLPEFAP